jgi:serine/threonine protein kinase
MDLASSAAYYKLSADQGNGDGAFQYALCLHYGIGVDIDIDEACKYYELAASQRNPAFGSHSFRCLRGLNSARFTVRHFSELCYLGLDTLEQCMAMRSFSHPLMVSDYCAEPVQFQESRLIASGGSSCVTLETDPMDGRKFAVKHISTVVLDKTAFFREIEVLTKLNHPCVLRILGWSFPSKSTDAEIHTEYAVNGSMRDVLERVQRGSKFNFWNATGKGIIICGIVLGMRFVHSHGIMHRDLEPSNILISDLGHALISDFGTSRSEWDDATLTCETGTVNYAAPEMYCDEEYTSKVDVFSFGLILYEILVGCAVFPACMQPFPIMRQVLTGTMPAIPAKCGKFMQSLIARCWSMNPQSRPSFEAIFVELQLNGFDNFPDADPRVIREYVTGILAWEVRYELSQRNSETSQY